MIPDVEPGLYKHFKGDIYEVLHTALYVDNNTWVVVYRRGNEYYTRDMSTWYDLKGDVYRFQKID